MKANDEGGSEIAQVLHRFDAYADGAALAHEGGAPMRWRKMTVQTGRGQGEWGTMISLIIIVEAAEGKADLFAEYLTEEARDVLKHEPSCRAFVVSRSVENPQVFTISELYDDQAALDAHRLTPHFLLFQQRVQEHGLIANKTPVLGEVIVS